MRSDCISKHSVWCRGNRDWYVTQGQSSCLRTRPITSKSSKRNEELALGNRAYVHVHYSPRVISPDKTLTDFPTFVHNRRRLNDIGSIDPIRSNTTPISSSNYRSGLLLSRLSFSLSVDLVSISPSTSIYKDRSDLLHCHRISAVCDRTMTIVTSRGPP